ncbi:MAG: dTMP kinase, partial [Rhodothermales bacterium]
RTYLIRLDPEEALRRRAGGADADRMERSDSGFYRRVVRAYDRLAEEEPERILCLDGRRGIDDLAGVVWEDLRAVLERSQGTAPSG